MSMKSGSTHLFEIQLPLVSHDKPESKFRTYSPLLAHLTHQNPKNSVRQAESARTQIGVRAHSLLRIRHKALPAPGADTGANLRRTGLRNASLPSESATLALGEFSRSSRVLPVLQFILSKNPGIPGDFLTTFTRFFSGTILDYLHSCLFHSIY